MIASSHSAFQQDYINASKELQELDADGIAE